MQCGHGILFVSKVEGATGGSIVGLEGEIGHDERNRIGQGRRQAEMLEKAAQIRPFSHSRTLQ